MSESEWKTLRVRKDAWETAKAQKEAKDRTWSEQILRPGEDGLGLVYTLNDPRTGNPRYVGATSNSPGERFKQHMQVKQTQRLGAWKQELEDGGLKPEMETVEMVALENLNEAETRVRRELKEEYDLLNGQHSPKYNW